jgi:hypothetical protein
MCGIEGKMYENEEEKEKNENTISNEETTYWVSCGNYK